MAADKLKLYDSFALALSNNSVNLAADDIKVALFSSTSNCTDETLDQFAELTNEISGNGYTASGVSLANKTLTETAGVTVLDADNVDILASGGSIVARYAVLYSDTSANNQLIGYILLDNTPANVTALDTQHFIIEWNANGILRQSADNT